MKTHFVTGAAGFIGSNVVDCLLAGGDSVVGFDNFSTGQLRFLAEAEKNPRFRLVQGDTLDTDTLARAMAGADRVWHFAANADIRHGLEHPRRDLEQNTIATQNVLEAMRATGVAHIVFASTGPVYGDTAVHPTPEDAPFPVQTSLYAASKLAAEGIITAYCEGFGMTARIFRFVSILGRRYAHGHVFDFCRKLLADPNRLAILGDGRQRKSYLHIDDCVAAMATAAEKAAGAVGVFNLGLDEYIAVDDSAAIIAKRMGLNPVLEHSGGDRGWVGDVPFVWLDTSRIKKLGWRPRISLRAALEDTVDWLLANRWIFESRDQ